MAAGLYGGKFIQDGSLYRDIVGLDHRYVLILDSATSVRAEAGSRRMAAMLNSPT